MAPKVSKLDIWLQLYLDQGSDTFLNAAESARAAGYNCKDDNFKRQGYLNKRRRESQIIKWMDEVGLSECRLKMKLAEMLDAKEIKVFQYEGKIVKSERFNALGIQMKALDMALKVKGLYAAEKRDHTVKEIKPPTLTIVTSSNNE
ncbi:hypothetical protein [Maridesulfovibrio ferrireducens]|uniref:hypothetical protein n=1 Tax=Maridesulfovibrio ferrireducens TaxID=246191 RepID=UPI001A20C837|nr:hypothetical protein [Maridesulfovibrio ferrireducens]MBI9113244.1 hypothetical protein [Maridesulfovibrio ferrireducens]